MTLLSPGALWLNALLGPLLALHLLRPRRTTVAVSSLLLWSEDAAPTTARRPWQRLHVSVALVLQCLFLLTASIAAARPTLVSRSAYGRHTVFVVDVTSSMAATDGAGGSSRLDEAKRRLHALRRKLGSGTLASIVTIETRPRVVLSASPDSVTFGDAVDALRVVPGPPDTALATTIAEGLQSIEADTRYVLLSDAAFTRAEIGDLPPFAAVERVGSSGANVALSSLAVRSRGANVAVEAVVRNHGRNAVLAEVSFAVDGAAAGRPLRVTVAAGQFRSVSVQLPNGAVVHASMRVVEGDDTLASDNQRWAVSDQRSNRRVLVVGPNDASSRFIAGAIGALPGVDSERSAALTSEQIGGRWGGGRPDVIVADRVDVAPGVTVPVLAIAPPAGRAPITVQPGAPATSVAVVAVRADDPLLVGLDLSEVTVSEAQRIAAPDADVIVGGVATPLIVRTRTASAAPMLYVAFDPGASTLPLDPAFPVLIDRAIRELAGSADNTASLSVGAALPLSQRTRPNTVVAVRAPDGTVQRVDAEATITADRVGIWQLSVEGTPTRLLAVNEAETESAIAPGTVPALGDQAPGPTASRTERPVTAWVLALLGVIAVAEFLVVRRRLGVRTAQRRSAKALRPLTGMLVLFAAFVPHLQLPVRDVSVVFAVDVSDSLGPVGRQSALGTVAEALGRAPNRSRAGVVLFGGNARVATATRRSLDALRTAGVLDRNNDGEIDRSRSDLAAALSLAAAVTPSDAARRVVLVSDGRRTGGDEVRAVEELRRLGVRVDAIAVGDDGADDAAIVEVTGPGRVRAGEPVEITVVARANTSQDRTLVLRVGASELLRRAVSLRAGDNEFTFTVDGLAENRDGRTAMTVTATVEGATPDDVPQNDTSAVVVTAEGPARVLVLDGGPDIDGGPSLSAEGSGAALASLLSDAGMRVDRRPITDLPPLSRLSAYAAMVLVDVPTSSLSFPSVQMIDTAVRELGVGLTVIGGASSYGSGGYLGSALEELLPVVSEVDDPKRRKPVAEVMAIDVSGSMSETVGSGRTRLDIARTAARAAIATLADDDQAGVLAVDDATKWIMDVRPKPSDAETSTLLASMQIGGGTQLAGVLDMAASQLPEREKPTARHVFLLTDGFTSGPMQAIVDEAAALRSKGLRVSVVGAGPDVEPRLVDVAVAGGGRFVRARGFEDLPRLLAGETEVVKRNLVAEGRFDAVLTGSGSGLQGLQGVQSAPPLDGYQATTAKPLTRTSLRIGPERDPLLSSWRVGAGRVTSWTSDAGARWAAPWLAFDGAGAFWSTVVKDTISPSAPGSFVRAALRDETLEVRAERPAAVGSDVDGTAVAVVSGPGGRREVALVRGADGAYVGSVPVDAEGEYGVGVRIERASGAESIGSTIAVRGYSAEYRPRAVERERLDALSRRSGGRGLISASQAFDGSGLRAGRRSGAIPGWLLPAVMLLFVFAVAVGMIPVPLTGRLARFLDRVSTPIARLIASARRRRRAPMLDETGSPNELVEPPRGRVDSGTPESITKRLERAREVRKR